jgi:hypothetical protein
MSKAMQIRDKISYLHGFFDSEQHESYNSGLLFITSMFAASIFLVMTSA